MSIGFSYNIALVGRPNVGKSRLFNRLIRKRLSIVHDQAGVTRDVIMHELSPNVILMDTGGIGLVDKSEYSGLTGAVEEQAFFAISAADMILFVVDSSSGIVPLDYEIAELLRKSNKPVVVLANKIDCSGADPDVFQEFGFEVLAVSAEHGQGESELRQLIMSRAGSHISKEQEKSSESEGPSNIKVCFVGRPNVGKSSTINALLKQNRLIVSDIPGTTRESVRMHLSDSCGEFELIDTAGMRTNNRINTSLDYFSSLRTQNSIQDSDVVFMLLDAEEGVTMLDKKIANLVIEAGKGLIVVVNKWDIAQERIDDIPGYRSIREFQEKFAQAVNEQLIAVPGIHVLFISAEKRYNIGELLPEAKVLYNKMCERVGTGELNRVIQQAFDIHPPSTVSGKQFKIYYAVQTGNFPFTFKIFCNHKSLLNQTYKRYLLNYLRRAFDFWGCAVSIEWLEKERRFRGDR
ncbi:MAG: ribosome biogenesis GTPase Der [Opitutales bacterium]|nr:ribosome biogenesis GTPase Der [Opitutales bacterium]